MSGFLKGDEQPLPFPGIRSQLKFAPEDYLRMNSRDYLRNSQQGSLCTDWDRGDLARVDCLQRRKAAVWNTLGRRRSSSSAAAAAAAAAGGVAAAAAARGGAAAAQHLWGKRRSCGTGSASRNSSGRRPRSASSRARGQPTTGSRQGNGRPWLRGQRGIRLLLGRPSRERPTGPLC